ncbi:MAG TPA: PqiC family protein [Candidatus Sulfotelmatobacter sp.]|nr:PqiC family protein [Candidatus Sulfotelmatobacter sp.]
MRRGPIVITALGLSILLVALTGCVGSSAPARLYVLTPAPETAAAPLGAVVPGGPALGVGPVRLPGLLDQPQIVTRRGAEEIDQAEFHRWAEPLSESVPRILGENLAALRKTERVVLFAWDPAPAVRHQVVVDVMRFDGALGGDVVLDARWWILETDGQELAANRAVLTQPTGSTGYSAVVAAMSRALAELSRQIAATLETLPRTGADASLEGALPSPAGDRVTPTLRTSPRRALTRP